MSDACKLAELELKHAELSYIQLLLEHVNEILKRSTKMDVTAAEFKTKLEGMLATIDAEKAEVAAELQRLKSSIDGGVTPGVPVSQDQLNEMNEILDRAIDKVKGIFNVDAGTPPVPPIDGSTPTEFTNPRTDSNGNRFDASGNIVSADGTVLFAAGSFVLDSSGRAMNSDGTAILT